MLSPLVVVRRERIATGLATAALIAAILVAFGFQAWMTVARFRPMYDLMTTLERGSCGHHGRRP